MTPAGRAPGPTGTCSSPGTPPPARQPAHADAQPATPARGAAGGADDDRPPGGRRPDPGRAPPGADPAANRAVGPRDAGPDRPDRAAGGARRSGHALRPAPPPGDDPHAAARPGTSSPGAHARAAG